MLEYLHIRNLALIEDMSLEFSPGMNVLTGETGAGKSFVLKALGFLLGDRLSAAMVRPGAERAQVEALFLDDGHEIVLRRELPAATGRSRLYVNDSLHSQDSLRELRQRLVMYTSQHGQQQLLQPAFQARLAEERFPQPELLEQRDKILEELHEVSARREALLAKQHNLAEKRELLEMQQSEIDNVAPVEGEEERLESLRTACRAQERLHKSHDAALRLLHGDNGPGLLDQLTTLEGLLERIAVAVPDLAAELESVTLFRQRLDGLAASLCRMLPSDDDINMDRIEERLFALAQLKRKLRRTLPEILALREEIRENLSFLDVCALDLSHLAHQESALAAQLADVMAKIRPLRQAAATAFAASLEEQLRDLGFSPQARVIPEFIVQEIWPNVSDERMRILWQPNPGQPPLPLDRIASGGELSRFLLAIAGLRNDAGDATYIFDEVDAGVGGLTLNRLAEKLDVMAGRRQMLLITHWPQLAAKADKHFQISKTVRDGTTFTLCSPLDTAARRDELARMAGGGAQGEAMARELLL